MKLKRAEKRAQPETIVALIDVVFFLLVFFMMVGRMDATAPFEVTPAIAQTGADLPAGGATLSLAEDGALALDAFATTQPEALARLSERLQDSPELRIRINAHKDAPLRKLLPLIAQLDALGAGDVVLVVTPGES